MTISKQGNNSALVMLQRGTPNLSWTEIELDMKVFIQTEYNKDVGSTEGLMTDGGGRRGARIMVHFHLGLRGEEIISHAA